MFKDPKQVLAMPYAVRQNCLGNDVRASNANIGVVKSVLLSRAVYRASSWGRPPSTRISAVALGSFQSLQGAWVSPGGSGVEGVGFLANHEVGFVVLCLRLLVLKT